jgi:hypothetical protein
LPPCDIHGDDGITDQEQVQERRPEASLLDCFGYFRIMDQRTLTFLSERCPTEAAAWEDAARRIER